MQDLLGQVVTATAFSRIVGRWPSAPRRADGGRGCGRLGLAGGDNEGDQRSREDLWGLDHLRAMTDIGNTRCIECGGAADQLNEDEEGAPCPACAERLLETLPGVFHAPWSEDAAEAAVDDDTSERAADERASSEASSAGGAEGADAADRSGPRRVD